jgi:hypothetical protein
MGISKRRTAADGDLLAWTALAEASSFDNMTA